MATSGVTRYLSPTVDREYATILQLLGHGFALLRFPDTLESEFQAHHAQTAVRNIPYSSVFVGAFTLTVGIISYICLPPSVLQIWLYGYAGELFSLSLVAIVSLFGSEAWTRHYQVYTGVASYLGLVGIAVATLLIPDDRFRVYSSYGVLFVVMVAYGMAFLQLRTALISGWLACLSVVFIASNLSISIDWLLFGQYFLSASFVGMVLCYLIEHHERRNFLQGKLLSLEKRQLDYFSQEVERLSQEDPLTGLANRRHFNEVFEREWERCRRERVPVSLVFADVDHFKQFNDFYGHIEGDRCLIEVASVLRQCARRPGDLAVRYGGEEFVLLLPNTQRDGALMIASSVLNMIDELAIPHERSSVSAVVTASMGVCTANPWEGGKLEALLATADDALYRAKSQGRHRVVSLPMPVDGGS